MMRLTNALLLLSCFLQVGAEADDRPKVVTVCEVIGNVTQYRDHAVVIVGRMDRSVSVIDHYEFLAQDGC
jgi:hypothetical protein